MTPNETSPADQVRSGVNGIEAGRAELRAHEHELQRVTQALRPIDEATADLRANFARLGDRWRATNLAAFAAGKHGVLRHGARPSSYLPGIETAVDALGLLAATPAGLELLVEVGTSLLQQHVTAATGALTLTREQRAERLTALEAKVAALRAADEAATDAAIEAGLTVAHRPDVTLRRQMEEFDRRDARERQALQDQIDARLAADWQRRGPTPSAYLEARRPGSGPTRY